MQVSEITMPTVSSMPTVFMPLLKRYTLEEFWELPEPPNRFHYELIEGVLYFMPPPANPHGELVSFFTESLILHLVANGRPGKVYHPRESIYLEGFYGTYLEPDMMYVSNSLREFMGERRTSADVVFEFLSPSTADYDRTTKAETYLKLGVKELWLIDDEKETVEIRTVLLKDGVSGWQSRIYKQGEIAVSNILEDWQIVISDLFSVISDKK